MSLLHVATVGAQGFTRHRRVDGETTDRTRNHMRANERNATRAPDTHSSCGLQKEVQGSNPTAVAQGRLASVQTEMFGRRREGRKEQKALS
jgi:hypothetical protein